MRHRVAGKKLSRRRKYRKALFKNLINSLIVYGEIKTTESKAKAVRRLVEKIITKGKTGTLTARRIIAAFLQDKKVVNKIIDEIAPLFKNRPGGYTRIVRLDQRKGDNATIVKLELVQKPESKTASKEKTSKLGKTLNTKREKTKKTPKS